MLKAFCAEVRFLRASKPGGNSREVLDEPQSISQETLRLGPGENSKAYQGSDLVTDYWFKCRVQQRGK